MHRKLICVPCRADGHAAGTPCTDLSSQGLQHGLNGITTLYLLARASLMNGLEPTVTCQENVDRFPTNVLKTLLGAKYVLEWYVDDSVNFG